MKCSQQSLASRAPQLSAALQQWQAQHPSTNQFWANIYPASPSSGSGSGTSTPRRLPPVPNFQPASPLERHTARPLGAARKSPMTTPCSGNSTSGPLTPDSLATPQEQQTTAQQRSLFSAMAPTNGETGQSSNRRLDSLRPTPLQIPSPNGVAHTPVFARPTDDPRSPRAGLQSEPPPPSRASSARSAQSCDTEDELDRLSSFIDSPGSSSNSSQLGPQATKEQDPDEVKALTLQGTRQLAKGTVGSKGVWGGLKSLFSGNIGQGLGYIADGFVQMAAGLGSMALDLPRWIGEQSFQKGQHLVNHGTERGGLLGGIQTFLGGVIQFVGGIVRLAMPITGIALMAAATGPIGWYAGAVILGIYLIREGLSVTKSKVHNLQTVKAARGMVRGVATTAGVCFEPLVWLGRLIRSCLPAKKPAGVAPTKVVPLRGARGSSTMSPTSVGHASTPSRLAPVVPNRPVRNFFPRRDSTNDSAPQSPSSVASTMSLPRRPMRLTNLGRRDRARSSGFTRTEPTPVAANVRAPASTSVIRQPRLGRRRPVRRPSSAQR